MFREKLRWERREGVRPIELFSVTKGRKTPGAFSRLEKDNDGFLNKKKRAGEKPIAKGAWQGGGFRSLIRKRRKGKKGRKVFENDTTAEKIVKVPLKGRHHLLARWVAKQLANRDRKMGVGAATETLGVKGGHV